MTTARSRPEASNLGPSLKALQRLATVAATAQPNRKGLVRLADTLKLAIGAEQVWFVYAEDDDWIICGDSVGGDEVGTGRIGLWIVQQQAQTRKAVVAFNIQSKRVTDLVNASSGRGREYRAMRIPLSESPAEMVIIRGCWKEGLGRALVRFLRAARPSLVVFLERMLNAARAEREHEQKYALANAAEVLTRGEEPREALASIASAMSSSSGFDLVTIVLWDEAAQKLGPRVINKGRWEETSLNQLWINPPDSRFDAPFIDTIRAGEPQPSPDVQNDSRTSKEFIEFCRGILAVSGAIVPVYFGNEPLAAISFAGWKPHTFPPEEVELLKGLASKLAVGLKAMQMYKALAESRAQLEKYTQQLEANTRIEHRLARTDALTGIPNRRYVEEVIDAENARAVRHGGALSVGILDVDKLKEVNDRYGHSAGDELLVQLAQLARRSCRRGDVVGRYGGDEFLFVLPGADLPAALRFVERFRSKVERQPFRLPDGESLMLNVSLGVACVGAAEPQEAPGLIASADAALYRAKSGGRNRVCFEPVPTAA